MLNTLPSTLAASFWMPEGASTYAGEIDRLFNFILYLSIFFFVLIAAMMALFIWRYRHRPGGPEHGQPTHSTALELTWTIIPTILVVIIFYGGFKSYLRMSVAPPNAYEIQVTGRMWNWSFTYPNGHTDSELHIPVNTPIRLVMTSEDVIHSFFVPAFRIKRDLLPQRFNKLWFQAHQTGTFDIYCAEYCGTGHSVMRGQVFVQEPGEFRKWLEEAAKWELRMTPVQAGQMFYEKRGCVQCHSIDGSRIIGPSFKDFFGRQVVTADGKSLLADENYIHESIVDPGAKISAGFDNVMPSFKTSLREQDIAAIIAYLKTISQHHKGDPTAAATQPAATTRPAQENKPN